jgi:hypothetical protein
MPDITLAARNVLVYDGTCNTIVAGFRQFGTTSGSELYFCLNLCFVSPASNHYQLYHEESRSYLARDGNPVPTGNYTVVTLCTPSFMPSSVSLMPINRLASIHPCHSNH